MCTLLDGSTLVLLNTLSLENRSEISSV